MTENRRGKYVVTKGENKRKRGNGTGTIGKYDEDGRGETNVA